MGDAFSVPFILSCLYLQDNSLLSLIAVTSSSQLTTLECFWLLLSTLENLRKRKELLLVNSYYYLKYSIASIQKAKVDHSALC